MRRNATEEEAIKEKTSVIIHTSFESSFLISCSQSVQLYKQKMLCG